MPSRNAPVLSHRITYAAILASTVLWCLFIFLAPFLQASSSPAAEFFYRIFQPICHQQDARSFHVLGAKLAVCVRCSAIYVSFLAGILVYPLLFRLTVRQVVPRAVLAGALLPVVLEVIAEWFGWYQSTVLTRSVTGSILGFVLALVILPVALEAVHQLTSARTSTIIQP